MSQPNPMRFYLDVCCLSRLHDDQSQQRIRLETDTIIYLLERLPHTNWVWISSQAVVTEAKQNPNFRQRQEIISLLQHVTEWVNISESTNRRADLLKSLGFGDTDAVHVACAEHASATLLTTDDKLVRLGQRHAGMLTISVKNVLTWFTETF